MVELDEVINKDKVEVSMSQLKKQEGKKFYNFQGITLRTKIVLLSIAISIYPMILMGIIAAYNYDNIIKERFIDNSIGNMNRISSYLNDDVEDMKESILKTLQDPAFYDMVIRQPKTDPNSLNMYNLRRDTRAYLSTIVFAKKNFDIGGIYYYTNDVNIYYSEQAGLINEADIPHQAMRSFLGGKRSSQFYFTEIEDELTIYILQQLVNTDTFEPIGLLYYRLDPEYLKAVFDDGYSDADETLFLYSKEGKLIAREGNLSGTSMIEKHGYYNKAPDVYIEEDLGNDYYIITEEINALELTVITMISSDVLTQDSRKVTDLIVILYIANIPLFLLMAYYLHSNINKPVNHLIEKMNQFEDGRFDVQVEEFRGDEFGYLYTAFNNMTKNTNKLVNDVYIKELARKDAEIAALQEQINPHFLYNTLESINWRAQLAGENDIALMIQALSKLMDGSINRNNDKFITMEQEAFYMEQYMFLVQMRYSESLQFNLEIDEGVKGSYVPKLIIQPLLENAVKHGIEPVGEGTITLRCYSNADRLVIEVEDDGEGMAPHALQQIRDIIDVEIRDVHIQKGKRRSIGFQNVARRIELIYGGKASIKVYSRIHEKTVITLEIPQTKQLDDDHNIIIE